MPTKNGFEDLELGQHVAILVGAGGDIELQARVVSASQGLVALQLMMLPYSLDVLGHDAAVTLLYPGGRSERARVARVKSGAATVVLLEPFWSSANRRNQRAHRRVIASAMTAHLSVVNARRALRVRVRIIDLSGGGARIISPRQFELYDRVDLHLPLLDGETQVTVAARVVWISDVDHSSMLGLQFDSVSPPASEAIQRTVFMMRWNKEA